MIPIEIWAHIIRYLNIFDYLKFSSCNKEIKEKIKWYTDYPYILTEEQEKTYKHLISLTLRKNKILFDCFPRTGSSYILINYICNELKKNKYAKILIACASCKYNVWKRKLLEIFPKRLFSYQELFDKSKDNSLFLTRRKSMSLWIEKVQPSLLLLIEKFDEINQEHIDMSKMRCIIRYDRGSVYPLEFSLKKQAIFPFSSYPQYILSKYNIINTINFVFSNHHKITLLNVRRGIRRLLKRSGFILFSGADINAINAFTNYTRSCILYYKRETLKKMTPSLFGVVLIDVHWSNSYGFSDISPECRNSIILSENITHLYYYINHRKYISLEDVCEQLIYQEIKARMDALPLIEKARSIDPFISFLCQDQISGKRIEKNVYMWCIKDIIKENHSRFLQESSIDDIQNSIIHLLFGKRVY